MIQSMKEVHEMIQEYVIRYQILPTSIVSISKLIKLFESLINLR